MSEPTRSAWLSDRIDAWSSAGLITAEQATAIRAHERQAPAADPGPAQQGSVGDRLVSVVAIVGGVVLGLGIILLIAANWDGVSPATRLVLLVLGMLSFYGAGYRLFFGGAHTAIGNALLLVGTMTFGASLFLVGQTYHVRAHDPLAFLLWAAAAAAMAVIIGSRLQGALAVSALGAWWVHESVLLLDGSDSSAGALAICMAASLFGLALYAKGTIGSAEVERGRWTWLAPLTGPARIAGALMFAGPLLVPLSFAHRFDSEDDVANPGRIALLVLAPALVAMLVASMAWWRPALEAWRREAAGLVVIAIALAAVTFSGSAILISLAVNAALIAAAVGGVMVGIVRHDRVPYVLGVAIAVGEIALRYGDALFDLVPGSLIFIGGGILLLLLAWGVSRARRRWLEVAS